MKTTSNSLKAKAAAPAVITAVVVALAASGGALSFNHNETLLRDRLANEPETSGRSDHEDDE